MPKNVVEDSAGIMDQIEQFIRSFYVKNGYSPSMREIAAGVGVEAQSTVAYYVNKLYEEGRIFYKPGVARSARPLHLP